MGVDPVRILVVEDEAMTLYIAETVLTSEGFEVQIASSAQEALKKAESFFPDILISDWKLEGDQCGVDVAKLLCRAHPGLSVLLISGLPHDAASHAKEEGVPVARCLGKPCDLDTLINAVKAVVEERAEERVLQSA